ncbi:MAG TPA: hypothetical protein VHD60_01745 [Candidatus Saccharimonadales bacterium]|nr:hypothetical protein [Candidatus Saccharimonadales bacterium]
MDGSNAQAPEDPQTPWQFKPGETITPGSATPEPSAPPAPPAAPEAQNPGPEIPDETVPQTPQPRMQSSDGSIRWTASEFIAHHKTPGWYGLVALSAAVVAAVVYLLTRDKISTGVVLVVALVFVVYAARAPRQIQYSLDEVGLSIGNRYHALDEFRSFFVVQEGAFSSVTFLPMKRFAPLLTIYYDPQDEEKIISLLADRLPMEKRGPDVVDNFMRRIRF